MITVKVICDNGRTWTTGINTPDYATAARYFLGQSFVDEDDAGRETVGTVIAVQGEDEGGASCLLS